MSQSMESRTRAVKHDWQGVWGILVLFSLIGIGMACIAVHELFLLVQTLIGALS